MNAVRKNDIPRKKGVMRQLGGHTPSRRAAMSQVVEAENAVSLRMIPGLAMKLAVEVGWREVSAERLAEASGIDAASIRALYPDRGSLLVGLARLVDAQVLSQDILFGAQDLLKDRLLEILISRFEALRPYRPGLREVAECWRKNPVESADEMAASGRQMCRSLMWMACAARAGANPCHMKRVALILSGIWVLAFRVWMQDDTHDLSRTLASLDRLLTRSDSMLRDEPRL
ncbi:MAG: hypothetical protein IPI58_01255 [Alphaproteobacteria bacterium]|nr:MAG: hypothetical protein IPI58_01255 [Alphaproteobacteria bacterium]